MTEPRSHVFPRSSRLTLGRDFVAVRHSGVRAGAGPLLVHGRSNDRGRLRLGLSISRRAGSAVTRNAIKRRLREAFRIAQHELHSLVDGRGYDLLISARSHVLLNTADYQRLLNEAVADIDRTWRRKAQRQAKSNT